MNQKQRLAIRMTPQQDKRRHVYKEDTIDIKARYKAGESIRSIARAYVDKCSRRLIQFIIFPARLEKSKQDYIDRGQWQRTYAKTRGKEWAKIMREHRKYKLSVIKSK